MKKDNTVTRHDNLGVHDTKPKGGVSAVAHTGGNHPNHQHGG